MLEDRRTLIGQHVRLGMIRQADIDQLIVWSEDPSAARVGDSGPPHPRPEAEQRAFWEKRLANPDLYQFAIRLTDKNATLIGTVTMGQLDWHNRIAELGIELPDRTRWGQGHGTEAMRLATDFAFQDMNLHRLQLGVFAFNQRAIACYERLGFVREGVQREYLQRDGERHDMILYGLLAHEWRASTNPSG